MYIAKNPLRNIKGDNNKRALEAAIILKLFTKVKLVYLAF